MTKICVAGVSGRMGQILIEEALKQGFDIVGAIEAENHPSIGNTLRKAGICKSDVEINSSNNLKVAVEDAEVFVSFTTPEAELQNLPLVADLNKRIVMGTTGLSDQQLAIITKSVSDKVPAVISPNFSIGVNMLFRLMELIGKLPKDYDFSITEIHHTGKKDAPSGTAKQIGNLVMKNRDYSNIVYGRKGIDYRKKDELEILSIRAGGVPGIHDIIIAGSNEMIKISHTAFSRKVFAQGALYAVEWICEQNIPGIYSMNDVLS